MVSIVLSSYNGEKFIGQQLESIVNQTYRDIEVVVVDDCSLDTTVDIVEKYVKKYNYISLYRGQTNLGYIKNFERGTKLAKGNYIAFSDQDDYWLPNKLEVLMKNINNSDVVYCDSELVDVDLQPLGSNMSTGHNFITSNNPLNFTVKNCVSGHAMLFKRDLLIDNFEFPELIPHDWWITFLASCNNGVFYIDKTLVKYRIHNTNQIGGEGHKKIKKEQKIKERKYRLKLFSEVLKQYQQKRFESKQVSGIFESYQNNSIYNRLKRVYFFLKNTKRLFMIPKKSFFKKIIYSFSMFFKIR